MHPIFELVWSGRYADGLALQVEYPVNSTQKLKGLSVARLALFKATAAATLHLGEPPEWVGWLEERRQLVAN